LDAQHVGHREVRVGIVGLGLERLLRDRRDLDRELLAGRNRTPNTRARAACSTAIAAVIVPTSCAPPPSNTRSMQPSGSTS
jgi:hypothetical protein